MSAGHGLRPLRAPRQAQDALGEWGRLCILGIGRVDDLANARTLAEADSEVAMVALRSQRGSQARRSGRRRVVIDVGAIGRASA